MVNWKYRLIKQDSVLWECPLCYAAVNYNSIYDHTDYHKSRGEINSSITNKE